MPRGGSRANSGGKRKGAGRPRGGIERRTALNKVEPEIRVIRESVAGISNLKTI
jgi:hypothetical protein